MECTSARRKEAGDLAAVLAHFMEIRFVHCTLMPDKRTGNARVVPGAKEYRELVKLMAGCLDLRKLCEKETAGCSLSCKAHLHERGHNLRKLHAIALNSKEHGLPEIRVLESELETLHKRLCSVVHEEPYKSQWIVQEGRDASKMESCTKIQQALYTESTGLCKGIENFLYFYQKCILKLSCEAVCEGAAGMVDKHGDKRRSSISPEHVEQEAIIDWNAPVFPEADSFLRRSMDRHFKRQNYNHGEFHFVQKSWRAQASEYTERSKVLQRKDAASSKYFYQRREKEDGKGKESRAGEPGAGAGDG